MAVNSRAKGARGERLACAELRRLFGWVCHRSQQYSGYNDGNSPDIIVDSTPSLFWEIKRVEKLSVLRALAYAVRQCGRKCPVVMHRPNRSSVGWMITIRLEDLPRLCHAYEIAAGDQIPTQALPPADASDSAGGKE